MKKLLIHFQLNQAPVEIMYLDRMNRITQRTILVKEVEDDHVRAFCTLRNQIRTFDINQILALQQARISYQAHKTNIKYANYSKKIAL